MRLKLSRRPTVETIGSWDLRVRAAA